MITPNLSLDISFFFIAIFFYLLARAIWQDPEIRLALKQIYRNSEQEALPTYCLLACTRKS